MTLAKASTANGERVLADLRALAKLGAYKTGVHRPSLSKEHIASLEWLAAKAPDAGLTPIIDGIGITATTTQDIWKDHPEKVLGTTAGNAVEVREAIAYLAGEERGGPGGTMGREPRQHEVTMALSAELLVIGGLFASVADARAALSRSSSFSSPPVFPRSFSPRSSPRSPCSAAAATTPPITA